MGEILNSIDEGDGQLRALRAVVRDTIAREAAATEILTKHHARLTGLKEGLSSKRKVQQDKEDEQNAAFARLEEESVQVAERTKERREALEAATKTRDAVAKSIKDNIEACQHTVAEASVQSRAAGARLGSMKSVLTHLDGCVERHFSEVSVAEVEREGRTIAVTTLHDEIATAREVCAEAEEKMRAAVAAVPKHNLECSQRARARRFQVRRAEEWAAAAKALADLETRGLVNVEDQTVLQAAVAKAQKATQVSMAALADAKDRQDVGRRADAEVATKLAAEAARATTSWNHRKHIVQTLESRLRQATALQQKAIHHHECAQAELKVVTEERQSMQLQVEKLQEDMERNEKIVSEAQDALKAAEAQQESEAPHRHVEEAASAVLKSQKEAATSLNRAMEEARAFASEAQVGATEPVESLGFDLQDNVEESSEVRSLTAARSTLAERQESLRAAIQAQRDTQEALDAARLEMQNSKAQLEEHTDMVRARDDATSQDEEDREPETQHLEADAEMSLRVANAEARVSALEQEVTEREADRAAAEAAEETANVNVQHLEKQAAAAKHVVTLEELLLGEIDLVASLIETHKNAHSAALQEVEEAETSWTAQRLSLSKSLHGATLQVAVAEGAVEAAKKLRKTVTMA